MKKPLKEKQCKICAFRFIPWSSTQLVCSIGCAIKFNNRKKEKAFDKKTKELKTGFKANNRKVRKAALKSACHKYIRERDKKNTCICCGELLGELFHAGHWLESGNNPKIRYNEDNIHGQRIYCNKYKGGDSGDYEKNLRLKIGNERVDKLLTLKGGIDEMSINDMVKLEQYYKNKLLSITSNV